MKNILFVTTRSLLFLTVLFVFTPSISYSGECLDGSETYLSNLASIDINEETFTLTYSLSCLYSRIRYLANDNADFGSPNIISDIASENAPFLKTAYNVLPKFLQSKSPKVRCCAIQALSYYQWPNIYDSLITCTDIYPNKKAVLFAIIGDKRAVPWIIEQYNIIGKKYRKHPIQSLGLKMTYLKALYHLAAPEALPFIEDIIQNPKPAKVRDKAIEIKERILALKNQTKQ